MLKQIRKEVYDYIKTKGVDLTNEDLAFLSGKIREHAEERVRNIKTISKRFSFTEEKIGMYLKKAKTIEQTERIKGNIEALELVKTWLSKDADSE